MGVTESCCACIEKAPPVAAVKKTSKRRKRKAIQNKDSRPFVLHDRDHAGSAREVHVPIPPAPDDTPITTDCGSPSNELQSERSDWKTPPMETPTFGALPATGCVVQLPPLLPLSRKHSVADPATSTVQLPPLDHVTSSASLAVQLPPLLLLSESSPTAAAPASEYGIAPSTESVPTTIIDVSSRLPVDPEVTEGCYLTWEESASGTMRLQYSKVYVEGAILYCKPGVVIPEHKFKGEVRRQVLVRGARTDKKKFYSAWCAFIKQAKVHKGKLLLLPYWDTIFKVHVSFVTEAGRVSHLEYGKWAETQDFVACMAALSQDTVLGEIKNIDVNIFIQKGGSGGVNSGSIAF